MNGAEDIKDKILDATEELYREIDDKKDLVVFAKLTGDRQLTRQCDSLSQLLTILDRCIQTGNYKRALRYLAAGHKILQKLRENEEKIQKLLTERLLEDEYFCEAKLT